MVGLRWLDVDIAQPHLTLLCGPANSLIHTFSKIEDSHHRAELRHGLRSIVGLTLGTQRADYSPAFDDITE